MAISQQPLESSSTSKLPLDLVHFPGFITQSFFAWKMLCYSRARSLEPWNAFVRLAAFLTHRCLKYKWPGFLTRPTRPEAGRRKANRVNTLVLLVLWHVASAGFCRSFSSWVQRGPTTYHLFLLSVPIISFPSFLPSSTVHIPPPSSTAHHSLLPSPSYNPPSSSASLVTLATNAFSEAILQNCLY